ncbi:MAG: 5'/3'-nucleotidase SurE [Lachnospiraceae bacterium]|nr:5'/3'-nucleotidase SurE [Lachnospiraceae bacterium]
MRILITNDDGIRAEGIRLLAEAAGSLGNNEIWVVAPAEQCSAMSQRITLNEKIAVKEETFAAKVTKAYSIGGTPADCVKIALAHLMKDRRPDVLFSGMNWGFNSGFDIIYSGTVGAAMEGAMNGIPSFAFSNEAYISNELAVERLPEIMRLLLAKEPDTSGIWNVNIPGCAPSECKGILWDRKPAAVQFYRDNYTAEAAPEGEWLTVNGIPIREGVPEGSDIEALLAGYISIGRVQNMVSGVDYER